VASTRRVNRYLATQRDLYKYVHDQTVRLMNQGLTAAEIARQLELPETIASQWHARGYYGDIRHNVKAIYQRYLGWYDANPANLDSLPPVDAGRKYVEYMGGAAAARQNYVLSLENSVLNYVANKETKDADAEVSLSRPVLDAIITGGESFPAAIAAGQVSIAGSAGKFLELFTLFDDRHPMFEIVEPRKGDA
jgi:alkyl sulfatase BDS1-like metallo-beta-lactamase superfamily hydrolase